MYNPGTGDLIMQYLPWIIAAIVALAVIIALILWGRKNKKDDTDPQGSHSAGITDSPSRDAAPTKPAVDSVETAKETPTDAKKSEDISSDDV